MKYLDPYSFYQDLSESGTIHWVDQFNAWVVTDKETITTLLNSEKLSAKRYKLKEQQDFDEVSKSLLTQFYSTWLMYNEGEIHSDFKNLVNGFIKNQISKINFDEIRGFAFRIKNKNIGEDIDIVNEFAKPLSEYLQSCIFESNIDLIRHVLDRSSGLVQVLGLPNIEKNVVLSAAKDLQLLESHFDELFSKFVEDFYNDKYSLQVFNYVLSNLLLDGHKSLNSAISNCIWYYLHTDIKSLKLDTTKLVDLLLKAEPPFLYISRIATCNLKVGNVEIKSGEKVILPIAFYNRCPISEKDGLIQSKHLSFGFGRHYCPGAKIAKVVLDCIFDDLSLFRGMHIKSYEWEKSFGYRNLTTFIVNISR